MERKITCSLLTPEKIIYEGDKNLAVVQVHDGEWGFLSDHTPFIGILGTGEVRLRDKNTTEYFFIDGGLVEIRENKLIILAEKALRKDELSSDEIKERINEINGQIEGLEPFSDTRVTLRLEEDNLKAKLKVALR